MPDPCTRLFCASLEGVFTSFLEALLSKVVRALGVYPVSVWGRAVFGGAEAWTARHTVLRSYLREHAASASELLGAGLATSVSVVAGGRAVVLMLYGSNTDTVSSAQTRLAVPALASCLSFNDTTLHTAHDSDTQDWHIELSTDTPFILRDTRWGWVRGGNGASGGDDTHSSGVCIFSSEGVVPSGALPFCLQLFVRDVVEASTGI